VLIGQFNIAPGIGQIFSHGDDRTDTDLNSFFKHFTTIRIKSGITDVGVGVDNIMLW
jgi:hypothetical protein